MKPSHSAEYLLDQGVAAGEVATHLTEINDKLEQEMQKSYKDVPERAIEVAVEVLKERYTNTDRYGEEEVEVFAAIVALSDATTGTGELE